MCDFRDQGPRRQSRYYVEQPDRAKVTQCVTLGCRSRRVVRNAGLNLYGKPYVVEGTHYDDITIYFESESNKQAYLDIPVECPGMEFSVNLDSPEEDWCTD